MLCTNLERVNQRNSSKTQQSRHRIGTRNEMSMVMSKKNRIKMSSGDRVFMAVVYFILILIAFLCVYPLYFTMIASISEPYAVYTGKVSFWPVGTMFEGYRLVFQNKEIWSGYRNSILYTVCGTAFNLFLTIPSAYALSKKRMLGRGFLNTYFLITMYFGGGMIPTYLLMKSLDLVNNPLILIIAGGLSVYNMIVTRVFFQNNIPESLYEAARLDGCSELKIFAIIVLPLSGPIIAVMALYYAVGHWNDYFTAMLYITKTKYQPLSLVLRRILILNENAYKNLQEAATSRNSEELLLADQRAYMANVMKFALVFIGSAPMLIAYPFVQKYFVKGVMIGSLKG